MDTLDKALLSIENVLKNIDDNELNQILSDIDNMAGEGDVPYFQYLSYVESDYLNFYNNLDDHISWTEETIEKELLEYTNNNLEEFEFSSNLEIFFDFNQSYSNAAA